MRELIRFATNRQQELVDITERPAWSGRRRRSP